MRELFLPLLATLLVTAAVSVPAQAANRLITYPAPAGMTRNPDFTVRVRVPGGAWKELFPYTVKVDRHTMSIASMASFDISGRVEVQVTKNAGRIETARIRPLSYGIQPQVSANTIAFTLDRPRNLSIEVNGDILHNLHLFANPIETERPQPDDPNVIYFGPGLHTVPGGVLHIPSGKTVYLAGGAVVRAKLQCERVQDVRICGRGIVDLSPLVPADGHGGGPEGVAISYSKNIAIDGIIFMDPIGYTVLIGQSSGINIHNIKAFSSTEWSDGIDGMSMRDVTIDGVFMRNSDDCIAIYGARWDFRGDTSNIRVTNSTLWADKAHPTLIGTHGYPAGRDTIENVSFKNIDILEHHELGPLYHGCLAINAGDGVLVRNVSYEDIRIEDIMQGQLVNLRVFKNPDFNKAPGSGVQHITFKNIAYHGTRNPISEIHGYSPDRMVEDVTFQHFTYNGKLVLSPEDGRFQIGENARDIRFLP